MSLGALALIGVCVLAGTAFGGVGVNATTPAELSATLSSPG